jgi:hypothetical protein
MKIDTVRRAIWAADAVLVAALAFAAVKVFSPSAGAEQPGGGGETAVSTAEHPEGLSDAQVSSITASGVIVPVRSQPGAVALTPSAFAIESNFEYKLFGTIVGPTMGVAFFQGPTGAQTANMVGDKLGDATLVAIEAEQTVLERGGERFIVKRVEKLESSASTQVAAAGQPGGAGASRIMTQGQVQVASGGGIGNPAGGGDNATATVTTEGTPTSAEASTEGTSGEEGGDATADADMMVIPEKTYKEYLQNIGKYTGEITILSHYDANQKLDGLVLAKVPNTSEAYKRGLREGDVVTVIQGIPITDTSVAYKVAWDILKNQDYLVDVTITRNGEEQVLTYEIWPE